MSNAGSILLAACGLVLACGCATKSKRVGQATTVQFGVVADAEQVTLDSNALRGALLGGTLGVVMGRGGSTVGDAARGAKIGAVSKAAAEGSRTGMAYTVTMLDGSSTRIVTDQREIHEGDCVAIERTGSDANIRRTTASYCDPASAQAVESVEPVIRAAAAECQIARQELADATTDAAFDFAMRKVALLCDA